RSPEEFIRNSFYEFTYEQQYCIIPFAKENNISVFPFDWEPPSDDILLVFGISDPETPPFARTKNGLWSFMSFTDSNSMKGDFYYADAKEYSLKENGWYKEFPKE